MTAPDTALVVPQWQGSAAPDAELLAEGAHRLADLLGPARRTVVDIDPGPGRAEDGVRHLDVLTRSRDAVRRALARHGDAPPLVLGGDCGVDLAPVGRAVARHGDDLAVVWFDAHADLNTPRSSPSGGFHGMVLRTLLGEGPAPLLPAPPERLSARKLVLAGTRALDPAEREFIRAEAVPVLPAAELADPGRLLAAVEATGAGHVHVHVDLDVLDPGHFAGVCYPEPDGLPPDRLGAALRALAERFRLAGLTVTEHAPAAGAPHDEAVLRGLLRDL
ncbi:arginase family protein [Streptomyces capparidis]